ncbi:tail spike protein [Bacillus phage Eldridge]|uniref:Tail spike protein n=1 Tax=Bacillus phage Eldridge TaxID=1776293 RepID=A0A109QMF5_9CAUD|nr:tail spike protein [Bacillus phage Eldridge]AMB18666.1 tail spike protein [Bacillus phage Eldridge]
MADEIKKVKIQVRRGLESELTDLSTGEPALSSDTSKFYVGTGNGNKSQLAKQSQVDTIQTDVTNAKTNITSLQTDNTKNKQDITQLKTDTTGVRNDLNSAINTVGDLGTEVETNTNDISTLKGTKTEVEAARGTASSLKDRFDNIEKARRRQVLTATTDGQKVFTITNGSYVVGSETLDVVVKGVWQPPNSGAYTETNSTTITLSEGVPKDTKVVIYWWEGKLPIAFGHNTTHYSDGQDPLDVTKLQNYTTEVKGKIDDIQRKIKLREVDVVEEYGVVPGVLGNAANQIQIAINACAANGTWVIIPKGDYYLEKSIIVKTGLKMLVHKDARMLRYHNDCMVLNGVSGQSAGQSNIWIEGGIWDCRGNVIADDGSAFAMGYASNITLRNLKIYNVNYSHGMEICAIDTADIEFCEGYGFIDAGGTRTTAEFIQIERGTTAGFPYFGPGNNTISKNIRVKRCKVGPSDVAPSFNVGLGSHDTQTAYGGDNIHVADCDFSQAVEMGIDLKGYTNVVIERTKMKGKQGLGIYFDGTTVANIMVRDCDITGTAGSGIRMDATKKIVIENTKVVGSTNAIYGTAVADVDICNKTDLTGQSSDALTFLTNSVNISVTRSIIRQAGRHGVNIYDNTSHVRLRDNEIIDVTTNVFNFAGSNTKLVFITGNLVLDTTLTNVVSATAGVDKLVFKENVYASAITTPINSAATNSTITAADNYTF